MTALPPELQGPTCIPWRNMDGKDEGRPHDPATYGRYLVIDLDENNRYQREQYAERWPDREQVSFGYGVCRHGFGLQHFGRGIVLSEYEATVIADHMNRAIFRAIPSVSP